MKSGVSSFVIPFLLMNSFWCMEYSYSSDKTTITRHLTKDETFRFDLSEFLDLSTISSNFSTNNPHLVLPGVKGRQSPPRKYFEEQSLDPTRARARYGHLTLLQNNGTTFSDYIVTDEKDIRERPSALTLLAQQEGLHCSQFVQKKMFFIFMCTKGEFPDQEYYIIVLDILVNEIILETPVQSFNFTDPILVLFLKDKSHTPSLNEYSLLIKEAYPEFITDEPPSFSSETRVVLVRILLGEEKENRKLIAQKMITFDEKQFCQIPEIEQPENCQVQLRNVNFATPSSVYVTANIRSHAHFKPSHRMLTCDFEPNHELEAFALQDCRLQIESDLLYYRAYRTMYAYIDTQKRLFFCKQSKQSLSSSCKSGALKPEWHVKHFRVADGAALMLVEAEATDIIFINYFEIDIFTWFYVRPDRSRFVDIIRLGDVDKFYLLRVPLDKGGFSLRNLQFSTQIELQAQNLQQLGNTILYQENIPILEMNLKLWDGVTVIDTFLKYTEAVVYERKKRVFVKRIGFQGQNLDFKDTALQKVYYFSPTRLHLPLLPLTDEDWNDDDRFPADDDHPSPPKMLFLSSYRNDLIYLFKDKALLSRFSIAEKSLIVEETNPIDVVFPDNFSLDLQKIIFHMVIGDEIIILSKKPTSLLAIDRSTLQVSEYHLPEEFAQTDISNCSMTEWFLVCSQKKTEITIEEPIVFLFDFKNRSLSKSAHLTNSLRFQMNEMTTETVDGNLPSSYEIMVLEVDPIIEGIFTLVLKIHYGGIFQTRGVQITFKRTGSPSKPWEEKSSRKLDFLTKPGLIKSETLLFSFDRKFLVLETSPKFALTFVDSLSEIPMAYLDTNEVLARFMSRTFRILVLIYRSLEDGGVYFAVYRLTPNSLKQFVRNQALPSYSPSVQVEFMNHSPAIFTIVFYDSAEAKALYAYTLFYNGPILLGKSHENILIDNTRYPLHLYEDKTMHDNRFMSRKPLFFNLEPFQSLLDIQLKTYFEVKGHVDYFTFDAAPDSAVRHKLKIVEGIEPQDQEDVITLNPPPTKIPLTQYVENNSLFAVNPLTPSTFSIFKKATRQLLSKIKFKLCDYCKCLKLALGESSLFCFHSESNQTRVAILDFKDKDVEAISMPAPALGLNYRLIADNSMFSTFVVLHHTSTALEILKLDKKTHTFRRKFLTAEDFGVVNLLISDFHVHYDISKGNINLIILNGMALSLHVYSAHFLPHDMSLTKIRTLNDKFSLASFNTSIFGLKCNYLFENLTFSCILRSDTHFYDMTLEKSFEAEISPFKWLFTVNYKYKNVFFKDFLFDVPRFKTILGQNHFLVVMLEGPDKGIALYERFKSSYVKDFQGLVYKKEDPTHHSEDHQTLVDQLLGAFLSDSQQSINIIGFESDSPHILKNERFEFPDQRIVLTDPNLFKNEKLVFKLQFFNGKSLKFNLQMRTQEEDFGPEEKSQNSLVVFLVALMIILIILILGVLMVLVMLLKQQKEEFIEETMISDASIMEESFRITNLRQTDL